MSKNKRIRIKETIKEHILNNLREYIIILLIFIIGIFLGVIFINNMQDEQKNEINEYINTFISNLKNSPEVNNLVLLKTSMLQNILLGVAIWFFGTTVIGIPVVFGIVLYRGFCLGYTISTCITVMGLSKGLLFILITLVLQNLIFIPAIIAIAVSGFKLYKSIVKDRKVENIKLEILRHTIFSLLMMILLIISSLIETFISTEILKNAIKYF